MGKLLSRRRRVRVYLPDVATAVLVFMAHVQFWCGSFDFGEWIESNFFAFLVFLLTPILLYLAAVLVLPELDQDAEAGMIGSTTKNAGRTVAGAPASVNHSSAEAAISGPSWGYDRTPTAERA